MNSEPIWIRCPFCDAKQIIYIFRIAAVDVYYETCFYCENRFCYINGQVIKRGW